MSNGMFVEETHGKIVVRFDRPEIRNPLSIEVLEQLTKLIVDLEKRLDVQAVVFTGTGDVFASGADLREIAMVDGKGAREFAIRGQRLMDRIAALSAPTIAVVNGMCFGGGLDLALACRRRIASPDAIFAHPGASLGIMTGWGGTQRLSRLIGRAKALEMFFTAARINADDALKIGLVDEVIDGALEHVLSSQIRTQLCGRRKNSNIILI
jgi:enoyl-CoA hydratase